jgi:hypothetical protein
VRGNRKWHKRDKNRTGHKGKARRGVTSKSTEYEIYCNRNRQRCMYNVFSKTVGPILKSNNYIYKKLFSPYSVCVTEYDIPETCD